jgi:hypothetical protein
MAVAHTAVADRKDSPTQPQHTTGKTHVLECGALPGVLAAHYDLEVEIQAPGVQRGVQPGVQKDTVRQPADAGKRVVRLCTIIRRAGDSEALRIPLTIREEASGKPTKFRSENEDGEMYSVVVSGDEKLAATLEMSNGVLTCKDQ